MDQRREAVGSEADIARDGGGRTRGRWEMDEGELGGLPKDEGWDESRGVVAGCAKMSQDFRSEV